MKKVLYKLTLLLLAFAAAVTSCKKFLDVNVNPNLNSDATLQELLPTAIFYTAESSYNQAYIACQYIQQIGSARTSGDLDSQMQADNADGWSQFYLYVLPQLNLIIKKGQSEKAPAYIGISKTLLAYNLGLITVSWENVPYSQADKENFAATYDSQETVYKAIQKLLEEGITELQKNTGTKPNADDLIYAGDLGKWIKLAYMLKARFALHLSVKNPKQAAQAALDALQKGFANNSDDFELLYNAKNLSPWYSNVALSNNTQNFSITHCATFIDMMNGNGGTAVDPRLSKVAALRKSMTQYSGVKPGTGAGASVDFTTACWHSNINSPIEMLTYSEAKAIEAEARFILNGGTIATKGTTTQGYEAYLEIIKANMKNTGVADTDMTAYLSHASVNVGADNLTLSQILAEKYKAMFLIGDSWTDYRRYDYLNMPVPANLNVDLQGKFIQRFNYPASETSRNSGVAKQNIKPLTEKMWMFTQ